MFYTIKQMAQQLGVTANKLRYYESVGLLQPHIDEKTGYRYYSVRDTRRFNATRLYRGFGLSIGECNTLMNGESHTALLDTLEQQELKLQREADYQADRLQALLFWKPFIASVLQDVGTARLVRFPPAYRITISRDEQPLTTEGLQECFRQWLEVFPVCTWTSRIEKDVVTGKRAHTHDYGLMMQERFAAHYRHLFREGLVERIEGGQYVYTVFCKNTDDSFHLNGLDVVLAYMQQHGLEVGGDSFSNCIYSTRIDGEIMNYHYFIVNVVKKQGGA